jgi:hypothetical protein
MSSDFSMQASSINSFDRRHFVSTAVGAGLAAAAGQWIAPHVNAASPPKKQTARIKIGQLGTQHHHASAKMATLRKLKDYYELVGVVEPDTAARKRSEKESAYRDLKWMTEGALRGFRRWP